MPTGVTSADVLQEQRDILEAGVRLGLAALAQGSPETARSHLEEALQRSIEAGLIRSAGRRRRRSDLAERRRR